MPVIWLKTVDSTNAELRRRLCESDNLSVIATYEQTAGRGQLSHSWYATPGRNLTFSILLKFESTGAFAVKATETLLLTCVASLSVRSYLEDKGVNARIKWPNDIWVGDRKVCGMLIENRLDGASVKECIIGIGLNINEKDWPKDLPNPVSLSELTGREYKTEDELECFLLIFRRYYKLLGSPEGRSELMDEFNRNMFRLPEEPQS